MSDPNKKMPPLWAALSSYGIGWLWVCCFLLGFQMEQLTWHYPLFTAVFFLWAGLLLRNRRAAAEHWFWMICACSIAVSLAFQRGRAAEGWAHLALHGFAAYWVLCRAGLLTEKESGVFLPIDLTLAGLLYPFGGFFQRILVIYRAVHEKIHTLILTGQNSNRKTIITSIAIIAASVPLFLLAGNLLGQADPGFARLLRQIGNFFLLDWSWPKWAGEFAVRFVFGLPVGAYLFGLVSACWRDDLPPVQAAQLRQKAEKLRIAVSAPLIAVLLGFIGMYLLFFGVQAMYLMGAFFGNIPGKLTAAQYARDGFFQLCKVMAINFVLLGAVAKISRVPLREHTALRMLAACLMVMSIFLAATAASKLWLYIHRFGFTPLRLLSAWAILDLTVGCILALITLHRPCKAVQKWIWFSAASFTLLCIY